MVLSKSLFLLLLKRELSSVTDPRSFPFSKVDSRSRALAVKTAQEAVTEYLHSTRLVPHSYAEQISKNALVSLSNLVSGIRFSKSGYSESIKKVLRYKPINEFEFFYESIGIDYSEVFQFLPRDKFFFYEDNRALRAACVLSAFGFPWNRLGRLYKEESCVFDKEEEELEARLSGFKEDYGFSNTSVVGICLAFPCVLSGEWGVETHALFDDLKRVFVNLDLEKCVERNVDAWFEVCRKIRVFYELGFEKGKVGDLMGERKSIFTDFPFDLLVQKVEYFCKFGVDKKEVGMLILEKPDILNFELKSQTFSVVGLLKHLGLNAKDFGSAAQNYPHVFGRNKMANLPLVMRAMDLHVWLFTKIRYENHNLLASYVMNEADEHEDKKFRDGFERIQNSRYIVHTMGKLDFLHGIGFGENALTIKLLNRLQGSNSELQERFDFLIQIGFEFSKLCSIISTFPLILNLTPAAVEQKVNYLCQDMGCSLVELYNFPSFLKYNVEKRIKPRFEFHMWLVEKGLCKRKYTISSIVAKHDKKFVARVRRIHPAAPKLWFELFLQKDTS